MSIQPKVPGDCSRLYIKGFFNQAAQVKSPGILQVLKRGREMSKSKNLVEVVSYLDNKQAHDKQVVYRLHSGMVKHTSSSWEVLHLLIDKFSSVKILLSQASQMKVFTFHRQDPFQITKDSSASIKEVIKRFDCQATTRRVRLHQPLGAPVGQ